VIRKLTIWPDKKLRETCKEVVIWGEHINQLAKDMMETMVEENGIGIAANQVGEGLRLFIAATQSRGPIVIVNPRITTSGEQIYEEEGCLSLPDGFASTPRYRNVVLSGQSLDGKSGTISLGEYDARIVQHEFDDLEGRLFTELLPYAHRSKVYEAVRRYKRKGRHDPRRVPDLRGAISQKDEVSLVQPATEAQTKALITER
jgi:peptide deformylase